MDRALAALDDHLATIRLTDIETRSDRLIPKISLRHPSLRGLLRLAWSLVQATLDSESKAPPPKTAALFFGPIRP